MTFVLFNFMPLEPVLEKLFSKKCFILIFKFIDKKFFTESSCYVIVIAAECVARFPYTFLILLYLFSCSVCKDKSLLPTRVCYMLLFFKRSAFVYVDHFISFLSLFPISLFIALSLSSLVIEGLYSFFSSVFFLVFFQSFVYFNFF